jgi:hypothetical protein
MLAGGQMLGCYDMLLGFDSYTGEAQQPRTAPPLLTLCLHVRSPNLVSFN